MRIVSAFSASFFLACAAAQAPADARSVEFAAHRAIYDLVLDRSNQTADLADMNGRIVMEFNGSSCRGYSLDLRFVTKISDRDGDLRITDVRTATFEGGDGKTFEFTNQTFIDEALTEESRGKAKRTDGDIAVRLTKPAKKDFTLDGSVVFPTEQILQIIEAARRQQHFLQIDVFDGQEDGATVYATTVVVGSESTNALDIGNEVAASAAGIAGLRHWPVNVSYFDRVGEGEQTPIYMMSFILYENGISRDLKIDYGNFVIQGRLSGLEMLAPAQCP